MDAVHGTVGGYLSKHLNSRILFLFFALQDTSWPQFDFYFTRNLSVSLIVTRGIVILGGAVILGSIVILKSIVVLRSIVILGDVVVLGRTITLESTVVPRSIITGGAYKTTDCGTGCFSITRGSCDRIMFR